MFKEKNNIVIMLEYERLVDRLGDYDWASRAIAAEKLGRLCDKRSVPALKRALDDNNRDVREYAADSLACLAPIGDEAVIEALRKHLDDARNTVRVYLKTLSCVLCKPTE